MLKALFILVIITYDFIIRLRNIGMTNCSEWLQLILLLSDYLQFFEMQILIVNDSSIFVFHCGNIHTYILHQLGALART